MPGYNAFLTTKPYAGTEREFAAQCDFLRATGAELIGVSEQGHSIQGQDKPIFTAKHTMDARE